MKHPVSKGDRLHEDKRAKAEARRKQRQWKAPDDPKSVAKQASCHSVRCSCWMCHGERASDTRHIDKRITQEEFEA